MDYSLDLLTSVAECDALLNVVNSKRGLQRVQLVSLTKKRNTSITQGPTIETEIVALTQDIEAYTVLIAQLPDGPNKDNWEGILTKAEAELDALEASRENYGLISRLQYEFTYNGTEGHIAKLDEFIVLVNAKKATL